MNVFMNFLKKIISHRLIIFIVEDNEVYSKSLKIFIQKQIPHIKEIKCFNIGEMFLTELYHNPDIVIVDYFLNSKFEVAYNGLEIINRIRAQQMNTNIIVLSSQGKFSVISEAIKKYDCFYVQKSDDAFAQIEHLINELYERKNSKTAELKN